MKSDLEQEAPKIVADTRKNRLEKEALKIIVEAGEEGILQSELWKKLEATSREGSITALRLEKRGIVSRDKELSEGRWTYRLIAQKQPITIETIAECPCFTCEQLDRCGKGGNPDPNRCEILTIWILEDKKKEEVEGLLDRTKKQA